MKKPECLGAPAVMMLDVMLWVAPACLRAAWLKLDAGQVASFHNFHNFQSPLQNFSSWLQ